MHALFAVQHLGVGSPLEINANLRAVKLAWDSIAQQIVEEAQCAW
jgi:hypothetical protein